MSFYSPVPPLVALTPPALFLSMLPQALEIYIGVWDSLSLNNSLKYPQSPHSQQGKKEVACMEDRAVWASPVGMDIAVGLGLVTSVTMGNS